MFDGLKWKFINTCYLFLKALKIEVNFSWRYTDKKVVVLQTLIVWKKSLVHYFLRDTNKFASFWSEVKYINSMYVRILHGSLRNSNILTKNSTKSLIRKKNPIIHKTSLLDSIIFREINFTKNFVKLISRKILKKKRAIFFFWISLYMIKVQ